MDALFYVRAIVALVFVLSLIGGLAFIGRRFGLMQQMNPGKQMKVIETCMIDPRTRLVLFRVGELHRVALIGANGCQFLNEDIELTEVTETGEASASVIKWPAKFTDRLKAFS